LFDTIGINHCKIFKICQYLKNLTVVLNIISLFSSSINHALQTETSNIERELLLLIAEGDEEAFRKIFHLYGACVHTHIFSIIKFDGAAKDLVQDTFLRVWLYRDKLPGIENFRSWILRISYNRALSYLRDKMMQENRQSNYIEKYGIDNIHNDTDEQVNLHLLKKVIQQVVQNLPLQQRKIYLLSREHGHKLHTIAEELGLANSTVKNTLGRALLTLRNAIEKAGFGLLPVCLLLLL